MVVVSGAEPARCYGGGRRPGQNTHGSQRKCRRQTASAGRSAPRAQPRASTTAAACADLEISAGKGLNDAGEEGVNRPEQGIGKRRRPTTSRACMTNSVVQHPNPSDILRPDMIRLQDLVSVHCPFFEFSLQAKSMEDCGDFSVHAKLKVVV